MSEHAWVLENVASYSAGGLEATERERLEQHTATCPACAHALEEVCVLDRSLENLFAGVRPGPALEDRLIHALRARPRRGVSSSPFAMRVVAGAAAVLLLGVLGAGVSSLIAGGNLPFPGTTPTRGASALNDLRQWALSSSSAGGMWFEASGKDASTAILQDVDGLAKEMRGRLLMGLGDTDGELPRELTKATLNGTAVSSMGIAEGGDRPAGTAPPPPAGAAGMGFAGGGMMPGGGGGWGRTDSGGRMPGFTTFGSNAPVGADAPMPPPGSVASSPDGKALAAGGTPAATPPPSSGPSSSSGPGRDGRLAADDYFKPADLLDPPSKKDPLREEAKPEEAKKESAPSQPARTDPGKEKGEQKPDDPAQAPAGPRRIIIRSGEIEFEVESFDGSVAAVTKLVGAIKGGFIATINSEKLPNGKVRGSVVVRVPPEHLDGLVLDLRKELGKGGELKGQRIGSQDITKQYTDLESRLRAARAMEERLLQIIKTGKGEIKDLLQAEKELGVWRTKIEEIEGELRYYSNLAALSTLTITLYEKEIRAPFAVIETERVQMGVEVEDVDQALRAALAAVADANGRVTKSEMKQHAAGQFSATLHFEVAPDAAGPLRDRLRQLGTVSRLEIDRLQETQGGSGRPQDAKTKRAETQFYVSLYNVANIAPRETVHLHLACTDAEAVYQTILRRVEKTAGRVVTSGLNRQKNEQTTGTLQLEVKTAEADAVLVELKGLGEVLRLQVTENPDAQNVTRSKRGFHVQLSALGVVAARETAALQVATRDVPAGYRVLQEAVAKAKGWVLNAQLNEQDRQKITAQLDFEVRRTEEAALEAALRQIGEVYTRNVVRAPDSENVLESKVKWHVTLMGLADVAPRVTHVLGIEVANVDQTADVLSALVGQSRGRTVDSNFAREPDGRVIAKLVYDVPLPAAPGLVERFKGAGTVRVERAAQNPQVPEGALALARLDVTLSNAELIVPSDKGLWAQIRQGLAWSFRALGWSVSWVIVGVCFVLPWALVGYGVYRLVLRLRPGAPPSV